MNSVIISLITSLLSLFVFWPSPVLAQNTPICEHPQIDPGLLPFSFPFPIYLTTKMDPNFQGEELLGVHYLENEDLTQFQIFIRDGIVYDLEGKVYENGEKLLFVMDEFGRIFVSKRNGVEEEPYGGKMFHHSSFLRGRPVAGAGEIIIKKGKITYLSDESGHYRPPPEFLDQFLARLRSLGVKYPFSRYERNWPLSFKENDPRFKGFWKKISGFSSQGPVIEESGFLAGYLKIRANLEPSAFENKLRIQKEIKSELKGLENQVFVVFQESERTLTVIIKNPTKQ